MRRKVPTLAILGLSVGFSFTANAWNSLGHRIVAQIAYDQLTPEAKQIYNRYNHALDGVYSAKSLVSAAPWLDRLRYRNELWLQAMHYIDIPYVIDKTPPINPDKINAVYAINEAVSILKSETASSYDKGFSLRVLLHVVGDIHQPMHAVNLFSVNYPKGDQGGNQVVLGANSVATNLHAYWDNGGGFLKPKQGYSYKYVVKQAHLLEKRWPCHVNRDEPSAKQWADESHQLAIKVAYLLKKGDKPSKIYQQSVKTISKQRLAMAGCRLGKLLNQLVKNQ
ncbi:3'-nucleotidase/nuclease [Legionella beliardensis]|uniref:3'-nucleotidase/nuclease n=2 Tax=Legionella beliardensis TaxID=91822 RepID=A0A378I1T4_9GAMM|nr:3'-nucleotidase/nuclease [Legionella beliardensis]